MGDFELLIVHPFQRKKPDGIAKIIRETIAELANPSKKMPLRPGLDPSTVTA
jgi:hypothetical protein